MIGILAGMGPKSTAPFIDKIVTLCQAKYGAKNDIDFPPMMIHSCPTPFYLDRPLDHAAMEAAIVAGTQKLVAAGAGYIAIPCNTAHLYLAAIRRAVAVPVLDMIAVTLGRLPAGGGKVAILATRATLASGLYQRGAAACGRECVARPGWQETVDGIIAAVKSGADLAPSLAAWRALCREIGEEGAAAVIACTDLNPVADRIAAGMPVVDSAACLAEETVDAYYRRPADSRRA